MKQYIVSIVSAALVCGILTSFMKDCGVKKVLKLLCGLFLTFTVIKPITGLTIPELPALGPIYEGAEEAAQEGESFTRDTLTNIITEESEAYILDKAKEMEVLLTVEVATSSEDGLPVPESVTLEGDISPEARQKLSQIITEELGIPKENQLWTGGNSSEK